MKGVAFVHGPVHLQRVRFARRHLSARDDTAFRTPRIFHSARLPSCSALQRAKQSPTPKSNEVRIAALAVCTVVFAVCNRVSHRMQLTGEMKYYTFFISQVTTLAYTVIYSIILSARIRGGIVPGKQLREARAAYLRVFAAIGFFEAIAFSVQLYAAARLPGILIGVLGQGVLPFTMLASIVFLGKRYSFMQVLGVVCVIVGVLTCTLPTMSASALTGENILFPSALFGLTCAIHALAIVLKEFALKGGDAVPSKNRAKQFDVFIVNSFGSAFQCLTIAALFPFTIALVTTLPPIDYIGSGVSALLTAPYMPWLTVVYIACNISFNIAALSLMKQASASVALLANLFSVPLVSLVFCLQLPLLTPSPFSWTICAGLAIIIAGVLLYNKQHRTASQTASDN